MLARLLVTTSLAVAISAQTFIVDAANGPGTNFVDVPPAIAAVPDGAVLRVRPGTYNQFTIDGKGLIVLCETGVRVNCQGGPTVMNLQPHQAVVLHGLGLVATGLSAGITCQNNQGCVRLASNRTTNGSHFLTVQHCDNVHVHDGAFGHPTNLSASTVVFTDSWFSVPPSLSSAIIQQGGRTQLVGCHVFGLSFPVQTSARAIDLNGGEVRALGGGEIVSHQFYGPPSYAVAGTGTLRLDPSVTVGGASPPIAPGIAVTVEAMPHVTATDGVLGGTSTATLPGPSGHLGLLAVGFAGPPVLVPVFADPLFWAPGTAVALTAGVLGPGQPITSQVVVPPNPVFAGLQLLYQGITLEASAGLQISNPAIGVVR